MDLQRASDQTIVEAAVANSELVVTHDLDFGTILAFSGRAKPSVIIFRVQPLSAEHMHERLLRHWSGIAPALEQGAIVTVEGRSIRIRTLPIRRESK